MKDMKKEDSKGGRLMSLDALRGFDMLFIMGLSSLVVAICKFFPDSALMSELALQMKHVKWDGLTQHDTIFPLFLFVAGISFPFSLAKQRALGKSTKDIYLKVLRRGITLVLLGFVYNGIFKLDFENMRYASVLGRIGLAWMFAALLFMFVKTRINIIISCVILVGYWLLLWLVPDSSTPFSFEENLVGIVDRAILPGRLIYKTFDPEGILSTLPAIVTAILGMFTGQFIKYSDEKYTDTKKVLYMIIASFVLLAVGYLWSCVFPINKSLWSSSFVCVVGGYSLLAFAIFYYIIDVKGFTRWTFFFRIVGLNSITIYLAQRIIGFNQISKFFLGGAIELSSEEVGGLIAAVGYIAVCWLFLYFLYRQKIFLKV